MQYVIPLDALPNQSFSVDIGDKNVELEFITRGVFMYMNLKVNEEEKLNGIICLNNTNLLLYKTSGLSGKLYFKDTQGDLDPAFFGLGKRWILIYEDE